MADENAKVPEPGDGDRSARIRKPAGERVARERAAAGGADDDGLDFEDDLGLGDDYLSDVGRAPWWMRFVYVIVFMVMLATMGYLVLIILYPEQFGSPSWIGAEGRAGNPTGAGGDATPPGFKLGDVRLGMAPDEVLRAHPKLRLEPEAGGGLVGAFDYHDGRYRVWFRALEHGRAAYRVQSQHFYAKISYLELLGELSERYGKPTKSGCGSAEKDFAIGCALQWDLGDTIVDALVRTAVAEGEREAKTLLSVTAADTRPPREVYRPRPQPKARPAD